MSKKHYNCCCQPVCQPVCQPQCGCNFSNPWTLVILILVVLQFSNKKGHDWCGGLIDNGILFIVALFLLVYCGCGKGLMKYDC